MANHSIFRFSADRLPVAIILSFSLLDFFAFFRMESKVLLATYWLIMIVPKGLICAWNHHHQHRNVFIQKSLNRVLEFFYALHTGVTTNLWLLHHNLGHHKNYLDQTKDQSRWKRKDGSTMGMIEYSIIVTLTAYQRGFQVGKDHPKQQKQFLFFSGMTFFIIAGLTLYSPASALFIIILPMISSLLFTSWTTYDHHAGLDTQDEFAASHNKTSRLYNILTGNLGYHTAHHYKQGVHWSKLPEIHEQIKHKIIPATA
ncbi:MAG: fatty acid desaturase [Gammaproteobacteria bacterium]